MFREIYELLNNDNLFGKGMEVEVLKGFNQHLPFYKITKIGYRKLRLDSYKIRK